MFFGSAWLEAGDEDFFDWQADVLVSLVQAVVDVWKPRA